VAGVDSDESGGDECGGAKVAVSKSSVPCLVSTIKSVQIHDVQLYASVFMQADLL